MRAARTAALLVALLATLAAPTLADAAERKQINSPSGTIRRAPGSYVIGNVFNGWTVDVQGGAVNGYRWGYIYNSYGGCAWVPESVIPAGGTPTSDKCGAPQNYPTSYFSNGQIGSNATGDDGAPAVIDHNGAGCNGQVGAYGNTRPFLVPAQPGSLMFNTPHGLSVRWRYVTKDGGWVMVHDPRYDPAGGYPANWYFVKRQCINLNPGPPPPPPSPDGWFLRNANSTGPPDYVFTYGNPTGDVPVVGDWNQDGLDTPGVVRSGNWYLRNSNTTGGADIGFTYGNPSDVPFVGDWNGDGIDTPGVFRGGWWYLRNSNTTGGADIAFTYGNPSGDVPVAGDWNGDGIDTIGVVRSGTWHLRNANSTGPPAYAFTYGNPSGDVPFVGDWDHNGTDTPGVFRSGWWYLRNSNSTGGADGAFTYGNPSGDLPLAGDWNGDGFDTPGIYR